MTDAELDDAIGTAREIEDDCSGSLGGMGRANLGNVEAMADEIRRLREVRDALIEAGHRAIRRVALMTPFPTGADAMMDDVYEAVADGAMEDMDAIRAAIRDAASAGPPPAS